MASKKRPEQFLGFCPVGYTIDFVSKKWAMYVIRELESGEKRFNEIYNSLSWGISPKTLTQRLKELEKEGVIIRRSLGGKPPRVEYSLTIRGEELAACLKPMEKWAKKHVKKPFNPKEKP
jgi:DNA-binding HxlR family transcriptional regulator